MRRKRCTTATSAPPSVAERPKPEDESVEIPHDVVNEQIVIAAACVDGAARASLVRRLQPPHFTAPEHRAIWLALQRLDLRGLDYDGATLATLAADVDTGYLATLADARPELPPNLDYHVECMLWDHVRAAAVAGPIAQLLHAMRDVRTEPAALKQLARDVGAAFDRAPGAAPTKIGYGADIARERPPRPMLSQRLALGPGRVTLLTAEGGAGKSITARALLLAVASGADLAWGCVAIGEHGSVLEVSYECADDEIDECYQRLAHAAGVDLAELGERIGRVAFPPTELSSAEAAAFFGSLAAGRKLIVIDSLAAATSTAREDENDNRRRRYVDTLTRVSNETGCTFLVIAHEGWTAGRSRGASAMRDAAQSIWSLTVADDVLTFAHTKCNTGARRPPIHVRLVDVGGDLLSVDQFARGMSPGLRVEPVSDHEAAAASARSKAAKSGKSKGDVSKAECVEILAEHAPDALSASKVREILAARRGGAAGAKMKPGPVLAALDQAVADGEASRVTITPRRGNPFAGYRAGRDATPAEAKRIDADGGMGAIGATDV